MNRTNARSPHAAPPSGLATEALDFEEAETTTPSTPYPGGRDIRLRVVERLRELWTRVTGGRRPR